MNDILDFFKEIFGNFYLVSIGTSWLLAQIIKILTGYFHEDNFNFRKFLFGTGGMPSSHSATVMSLVVSTLIADGAGSYRFAASVLMAIIVMSDAMGVRLETGKQAQMINKIVRDLFEGKEDAGVRFKELIGHTPFQVFVGGILGIIVPIALNLLFFCL